MQKREPVRVVHWGLGSRGRPMADLVWRRTGLMPVGAIDLEAGRVGHDLGELLGDSQPIGVAISTAAGRVLQEVRPEITLIDAGDQLETVAPLVVQAMEAGSNVICVAREMTYPWAHQPELADRLDDLAHAHGVTILGTGMHPGFLLDTLVINLTGCCMDVDRIRACHFADLSSLEADELRAMGMGLSPWAYTDGLEHGTLAPPGGLIQSIHLIADTLGWHLDAIEEARHPIIAKVERKTAHIRIEPGQVTGCRYTAIAIIGGVPRILLQQVQQVDPAAEDVLSENLINIEGDPSFAMTIGPSLPTNQVTAALAVNMIPAVVQSGPGLKTMADLPIPRAVLGDLRVLLKEAGPSIEEALASGWHQGGPGT